MSGPGDSNPTAVPPHRTKEVLWVEYRCQRDAGCGDSVILGLAPCAATFDANFKPILCHIPSPWLRVNIMYRI